MEQEKSSKPTLLEAALAFSPVPVLGEKTAMKLDAYYAQDPLIQLSKIQFSELFIGARSFAYSAGAVAVTAAITYFS